MTSAELLFRSVSWPMMMSPASRASSSVSPALPSARRRIIRDMTGCVPTGLV
jgi:hypothetical protein